MAKKIFKISVPLILIGIILFIAYDTYQKTTTNNTNPIIVIPSNASIIIQLNNVRGINRLLKSYDICKQLQSIEKIQKITKQADTISNFFSKNSHIFSSNQLFISLHKVSANKHATLFCTTFNNEINKNNQKVINLFCDDFTTSTYDNQTIYFSKKISKYFSFKEDIIFYSENKMLITDAIRTSNENTDNLLDNQLFADCYKTISKMADINFLINYNSLFSLGDIFMNPSSKINSFSSWAATDLKFKDNAILTSGISSLNSSINNFTDIFRNQKSQDLDIVKILPENTTQLFAISFENQQKIYNAKNKILQNRNEFWNWNKNRKLVFEETNIDFNEFINEVNYEAGIFNASVKLSPDKTYTYFKTKESIRATSMMQGIITSSLNYKDFVINKVTENNLTANLFGDFFDAKTMFFITINDYFIFGRSTIALEYIIDNYVAKNTLSKNKSFKKLKSYISTDANIFYYLNPGKTAETLKNKLANPEYFRYNIDSITKFTALTMQISSTKNGSLHNLCLFYDNEYKESIKEEWYFVLDTSSTMNPQFVKNHFTNEKMILIQDNLNQLIAINASGKKIWSMQLENKLLGEINYIDTYKNNKFQALFNTKDKLFLVDRNGRLVDGFPKELPTTTSLGHSLFDYDSNKKYRIIIVGDDNILYNLDKKGNRVRGWKYNKTANRINQKPVHFLVDNYDYILNSTGNSTTKLLARNGSDRVVFDNVKSFADLVKISNEGELYAITNNNELWRANVDGEVDVTNLENLQDKSKILAFNGGYYIGNNKLVSYTNKINNEKWEITLDDEIISIHSIYEYIIILTKTSLYLIKENKIVDGFPIESDGYFNIADIDNDRKINIVTVKNGLLYNYEVAN